MANVTFHNTTIAALVEPGDRLRTGERPDDFITVKTVADRPQYVKWEAELFDQTVQVIRIRKTDVVTLLGFDADDSDSC